MSLFRKPEVMSPVGGHAQLQAAVEAGADAVFFGVNPMQAVRSDGTGAGFHARAKVGFEAESLPELMRGLHERGVLGFVTFNVLVFDRELKEAEQQIIHLAESGVDALIVQDHGVARLVKEIAPDLPVHGSTQMSITSAEGAEFARRFGASRVVLGRELSLTDIERIAKKTDIELETFVHGALCVSYSGQCFSSEGWGGRSANRGQCAQACRLPYEMFVDGEYRDLGDARYLLSPGDLYALHQVPELVRIGVHCLKIEGRYKDAEFVALTTAAYRKAVDEACAGLPLSISPTEERDLEQVYSRGLGAHFISGTNHQQVVRGRAPRHRGVLVGEVVGLTERGVLVKTVHEIHAGDGLVFDPANWRIPEGREEGGFVYQVNPTSEDICELRFAKGAIREGGVRVGDPVWRTQDPTLISRVKPLLETADPIYTRPISAHVIAKEDAPIQLTLTDEGGKTATVFGEVPSAARNRALDETMLGEQLGKLGGTGYHLAKLRVELADGLFLPVSALNALRRTAVQALTEQRGLAPVREIHPALSRVVSSFSSQKDVEPDDLSPQIHVLVRSPEQLAAALAARPHSITLDYLELYGLKPAVAQVKEAGIAVRVASPRILKPTEQNLQKFLLGLDAELLVRSGGLLEGLQTEEAAGTVLTGDFSLNAANALTAHALLDLGLTRLTPTHDLNARQITELAGQGINPGHLEVIAYQHLPVFHTEHCVFCRFLSSGTDYTNCGHPCESHRVALKDERGLHHPVMADVGCRNTVFEARPQVAGLHLSEWLEAGIQHYRLEFVHETPEQVAAIIELHRDFFTGKLSANELERGLREWNTQGITEGSLFIPESFQLLPPLPML